MRWLSGQLYRFFNIWSAVAVTLLYGFFIATVMPAQSADSLAYAGEWGAPDRHFFYTPDELYVAVSTWGETGRQDYIRFRLGLDIIWALAYGGFLLGWISVLLRSVLAPGDSRRLLNLVPLIAIFADYSENALGITLVRWHETRLDGLAWLAAGTTSLKWVSLVIAHLILVYALWLALRKRHTS